VNGGVALDLFRLFTVVLSVNEYLYWNAIQWACSSGPVNWTWPVFGRWRTFGSDAMEPQGAPAILVLLAGVRNQAARIECQQSEYALAVRCWKKMHCTRKPGGTVDRPEYSVAMTILLVWFVSLRDFHSLDDDSGQDSRET